MGAARSVVQWLFKGPVLSALAVIGGWLQLDHLYEWSWRSLRGGRVRRLGEQEIQAAKRVFGESIPYDEVLVIEDSSLAKRIAVLSGHVHLPQGKRLAVTAFRTVHFSVWLGTDNSDIPWLIHELTHVWQYCQQGPQYLAAALRAQAEGGEGAYSIARGMVENWEWDRFNAEQQGEIARAYFEALIGEQDAGVYEPYIDVLRSAKFKPAR